MKAIGYSDVGMVRHSNQDAFVIGELSDNATFAVVCDGMGGANGGNVASQMAVDNLSASLKSGYRPNMSEASIKNLINSAVSSANIRVFDKAKENKELSGMGTTVVVVLILENTAYIAHAGDSRAYKFSENNLEQITRDHSIVQNMIEDGKLTVEEARFHPRKNVITRALGVEENVKVEFTVVDLIKGDKLLICTDGLSNYVSAEDIADLLSKEGIENIAKTLVDVANSNGGGDNITAVVIDN